MSSFAIHGTTTASTVYVATLDRAYDKVMVTWRSATGAAGTELYFTADGSTPAVAGINVWVLPAVQGATKVVRPINAVDQVVTNNVQPTVVKLISTGAIAFSVEGLD